LESRRYFVNADVTFFESTPFFSSPGQCLSPDLISSHEGEGSFSSPILPIPLLSPPPQVPLASPPNPLLQVYQRSQDRCVISYRPDTTSSLSEVPAPPSSIPETDDLPIALRRSKRTCTQHPIAHFLSYNCVSPCLHSFACTLSSISIPSSYKQALSSSG
ncbi:Retrovirus-related Pol polyprotein from transposon RE2, partial [Fagus crenata]